MTNFLFTCGYVFAFYLALCITYDVECLSPPSVAFAGNTYALLQKYQPGNFIYSPFATEVILSLLAEGAKGKTSNQFKNLFQYDEELAQHHAMYGNLLERMSNSKMSLHNMINIFVRKDLFLSNKYEELARSVYKVNVTYVNWVHKSEVISSLRNWYDDIFSTINDQYFEDLLKRPKSINLIYANALTIKASWETNFRVGTDYFTNIEGGKTKVHVLKRSSVFRYHKSDNMDAQFLELPFVDENHHVGALRMVFILPNSYTSLEHVGQFGEMLFEPHPFVETLLQVVIPSFTIKSIINMERVLKSLGLERVFKKKLSDLSRISKFSEKRYHIDSIVQGAIINVDHEGISVSSVSSLIATTRGLFSSSDNPEITFFALHPFMFYIHLNGSVLLAGRVSEMRE